MVCKKKGIRNTVMGLLLLASLILGLFVSQYIHRPPHFNVAELQGTVLDHPREIKAFTLTGFDQLPFNNERLKNHWTMMFFGFTSCGSICPTIMGELAKMYGLLEKDAVKNLPQVMMISVDPKRDSLKKLATYVKAFNPRFYGATGSIKDIKSITKDLGIAFLKVATPGKSGDNYNIEHTGTIMLFNPEGKLVAFFTSPHQASVLAKEYQMISGA